MVTSGTPGNPHESADPAFLEAGPLALSGEEAGTGRGERATVHAEEISRAVGSGERVDAGSAMRLCQT